MDGGANGEENGGESDGLDDGEALGGELSKKNARLRFLPDTRVPKIFGRLEEKARFMAIFQAGKLF